MPQWRPCEPRVDGKIVIARDGEDIVFWGE
jgi:hypothetical protein